MQHYPALARLVPSDSSRRYPGVRRLYDAPGGANMRVRTVLFAAMAVLLAHSAYAQVSTGNIIGLVHDESGAVLPGVTATLTSPALPGGPATTVTNARGEYRFERLVPGTYTLKVSIN